MGINYYWFWGGGCLTAASWTVPPYPQQNAAGFVWLCAVLVLSGVLSTRCFPSELCLLGALVLFPDCLWLLTFCSAALGGKKWKLKSVSTTVGIWGSVLVYSEILSGTILRIFSLIRVGCGAVSSPAGVYAQCSVLLILPLRVKSLQWELDEMATANVPAAVFNGSLTVAALVMVSGVNGKRVLTREHAPRVKPVSAMSVFVVSRTRKRYSLRLGR